MSAGAKGHSSRRLAVVGKGGVGKTAFAAMLARVLLESGKAGRLLAIDADPARGLTNALGLEGGMTMGQIREIILEVARSASDRQMTELAQTLDYLLLEALVERGALALLAMGRSESLGCFCAVNEILREAIQILSDKFDTILIDGEAGLEQLNRQVMDELDMLIIVTDPSSRGLQTVALLLDLVREKQVIRCAGIGAVFNRVTGGEDRLGSEAARLGIDILGYVPQDPFVAEFDLVGRTLAELPADSAALTAVRRIAARL